MNNLFLAIQCHEKVNLYICDQYYSVSYTTYPSSTGSSYTYSYSSTFISSYSSNLGGSMVTVSGSGCITPPNLPDFSYGFIILTLTPIIPYLKNTCLTATSRKSTAGWPVQIINPYLNFIVFALYYLNLPETITSQPKALSFMTALIID